MTDTEKIFIQILKSAVHGEVPPAITNWQEIWELAIRHHLEVMVYETVKDTVPEDMKTKMVETYNKMIARDILQSHCIDTIEKALKSAGIHYAILKGGVLKADYPRPYYRYMTDLDFYIMPEDRAAIRKAMEGVRGVLKGRVYGDDQFVFINSVGVEFHGRLCYRKKNWIENYSDWSFVDIDKDRLTEEGYALNLIGHVIYDMSTTGPGIRYILDIWIYKHFHQPQPDWEEVEKRLREDGIYEVAHNLMELSEVLFGEKEGNELMTEMTDYVMMGGLHGDQNRSLVNQAGRKAIIYQLFRDRTEFENRYPWLKKYPYLLPAAWVMRIVDSLKRHKGRLIPWWKSVRKINKDDIEKQKDILKRFGF